MALKEVAACPAGHAQTYVTPDAAGRCTRCGSVLVKGYVDDALPVALMEKGGERGKLIDPETGQALEVTDAD